MEYIILSTKLMAELEKHVSEYIKMGWKPIGGVSFNANTNEVMQAMTK